MNPPTFKAEWNRWWIVVLFATAMAWVESAVVFYLRTHIDRIVPYQANPLPVIGGMGPVELMREFATLVMLFTVGMLAGGNWRARFGYMLVAFGVWDIFYYVFLKVMCGWPQSLFDWDILFLIPLPWWGPVLAPVLIALLMIFWGTLTSQRGESMAPQLQQWTAWGLNVAGGALALRVFMADTLRAAPGGIDVIRTVLPAHFHWGIFLIALVMMAAPVACEIKGILPRRKMSLEKTAGGGCLTNAQSEGGEP